MVKGMAMDKDGLLLGIDWGTSNRRAYLVNGAGDCLRRHADDQGLLAVEGGFAASLDALRAAMQVAPEVPVVMAGMVGSASGWQEVPYLDTSVPLERLPRHLSVVRGRPGCAIVPGYRSDAGAVDVMRGEETQLLGAVGLGVRDGWVVLPGTHSKWVLLREGRVEQLRTYVTGELFALLGKHGTLNSLVAGGGEDAQAFGAGLDAARAGNPLSNSLFGVRARVVTGRMPAAQARSFLSGLLIGTEFVDAARHGATAQRQDLHVIASPALMGSYAEAARHFGSTAVALDPDAVFLSALSQFIGKEAHATP